jgi:hypothetical protein
VGDSKRYEFLVFQYLCAKTIPYPDLLSIGETDSISQGYLSVPRSGSKYKIEREAIRENSFDGTKNVALTEKEIDILDGLDERLPAGKLGIVDGWTKDDIPSVAWDPTLAV